jgi:AcrR family transcriptional regulator
MAARTRAEPTVDTAPPLRQRTRRSQSERSAATRAKVVRAATECVAEQGFRGATMSAIAARAGVSWGAMQHQFGDKDAILDAVLEQSLQELGRRLLGVAESHADPAARVRAFVTCCRELLQGPSYRAFVEIQLSRGRGDGEDSQAWADYVGQAISEIWQSLFGDLGLPAREDAALQRFTFALLSGVAAESMLFPGIDFSRSHLDILQETLLRKLGLNDS